MNLICINCPRGCHLQVEMVNGEVKVEGNLCPRGVTYGINEMTDPKRTLTTTVAIDSRKYQRLPIISDKPLPKDKMMEAMKQLKNVRVKAPINRGEVIVSHIAATESDMVASKTIIE